MNVRIENFWRRKRNGDAAVDKRVERDVQLDDPHADCRALGSVFDRVGNKWTVMVVGTLSNGSLRFNQIMHAIGGVSHRMLTLTLRGMERDGLVTRTSYPTVPPKVEYELTDAGRSLIDLLKNLSDWAQTHRPAIENSRESFDRRKQGLE